jgi:hypothetical protein
MDSLRPLKALGIGDLEAELYRWLLCCPGSTLADVGRHVSAEPDSLREAVAALEQAGLITRTLDQRLVPTAPDVGLYDLATGSGTLASPGGFIYEHPAADGAHHEFVTQEVSSPDENLTTPGLGAVPNNNARSSMVVLNEQGQVLSRVEQFNFFNVFTSIAGQLTQLEPASQQGYTLGLDGDELQPFSY